MQLHLTVGAAARIVFVEPRSESMMWINQLRWAREPRAAQPDR
jgi:hypothetical protein